jgi:DNA (cytosine-5)-methyltransferase 1
MNAFHAPQIATKNLKFNSTINTARKVRVSTNILPLMGFEDGMRLAVQRRGPLDGFEVVPAMHGQHKVHSRTYRAGKRSNNPLETLVEFGSQDLIDNQFPKVCERFHLEMRNQKMIFRPIANRSANIMHRFKKASPLNAFVGLTGGVDIHALESMGFKVDVALEYRPTEKRDRDDKTEVNLMNCLRNSTPSVVLNEDLYHCDLDRLSDILADRPPIGVAHYSIQCDDFSTLKSANDKERDVADMSSTIDQFIPMLDQIKVINPAVVIIENVVGFGRSMAGKICETQLRRMGYHVTSLEMDARDYGGIQSRKRYYCIASVNPGFQAPEMTPRNTESIWSRIEPLLGECRDITDTAFIKNRATSNRAAPSINPQSTQCQTIIKSNSRGIKDGAYLEVGGRMLMPSDSVIKRLMSIPDDFHTDWMAGEQAIEILGQSIDYAMHESLMSTVKDHLAVNFGESTVVNYVAEAA